MSEPKKTESVGKALQRKTSGGEIRATSKESNARMSTIGSQAGSHEEMELKYGATHVIQLFVPITICLIVVIISVAFIPFYGQQSPNQKPLLFTPFSENRESATEKVMVGIANALILMLFIVLATCLLITLYYYRWYKVIFCWLIVSSFMILFIFSLFYLMEVCRAFDLYLDWITAAIFTWNIGWLGIISIYWKAPIRIQQGYYIYASVLTALIFIKMLPLWTTWIVLGALVVWDLVAVLCPYGPLRILVETTKDRNEPIMPGMVYSSMAHFDVQEVVNSRSKETNMDKNSKSQVNIGKEVLLDKKASKSTSEQATKTKSVVESRQNLATKKTSSNSEGPTGVKLGLGDFIFYSVLIGKSTMQNDLNTTLACFVAILIGLCLTLMLLAIYKKALPALPISLTFGLIFLSCTRVFVKPFADELSELQVFV